MHILIREAFLGKHKGIKGRKKTRPLEKLEAFSSCIYRKLNKTQLLAILTSPPSKSYLPQFSSLYVICPDFSKKTVRHAKRQQKDNLKAKRKYQNQT